jgi:hypothetical protein
MHGGSSYRLLAFQVPLVGKTVTYVSEHLNKACRDELEWAWSALHSTTCCQSFVAFWKDRCIAHQGLGCESCDPHQSTSFGPICQAVIQEGKANYLGSLVLYPGVLQSFPSTPGFVCLTFDCMSTALQFLDWFQLHAAAIWCLSSFFVLDSELGAFCCRCRCR